VSLETSGDKRPEQGVGERVMFNNGERGGASLLGAIHAEKVKTPIRPLKAELCPSEQRHSIIGVIDGFGSPKNRTSRTSPSAEVCCDGHGMVVYRVTAHFNRGVKTKTHSKSVGR